MPIINKLYDIFKVHKLICTDSRIVTPNSIFFALQGDNFDGNKFVNTAMQQGCAAAVTSDKSLANDENIFYVDSTLHTLQALANYHRHQLKIPIIAITGTNGKTTTKDLISSVLAQRYRVSYTGGNKNNHIGVPLTLLAMNDTIDIGIVEMGANHPKEIEQLCQIADPDFGLITNIGKAHLEGFGDLNTVINTKAELYDFLMQKNAVVFKNADNTILNGLAKSYHTIDYGISDKVFCQGTFVDNSYYAAVKWHCKGNSGFAKSNLIGRYNFENILAAIAIGNYFDVPATAIDTAISNYVPRNNRSQLVETKRNTLILDLYNANPTSMHAAIENFNNINEPRKSLILGDMLELGKDTLTEHRNMLEFVKQHSYSKVFLVGEAFYHFKDDYNFIFFRSVDDIAKNFIKNPESRKFFLVKGSRGIKLERCVDYL